VDTATLIRSARQRAGLTQTRLAMQASTSAPTISAYEHGTKQPRSDVLLRLLRAAGFEPMLVPVSTGNGRYVDLFCDELAAHVRQDREVLEQARHELDRMNPSDNVEAWRSLLDAGPSAVVTILTSRDPEARGLKADNPFARLGVVDEDTRLALLRQARAR
jgi:transcriptional regulator with XRE-family HTH domain